MIRPSDRRCGRVGSISGSRPVSSSGMAEKTKRPITRLTATSPSVASSGIGRISPVSASVEESARARMPSRSWVPSARRPRRKGRRHGPLGGCQLAVVGVDLAGWGAQRHRPSASAPDQDALDQGLAAVGGSRMCGHLLGIPRSRGRSPHRPRVPAPGLGAGSGTVADRAGRRPASAETSVLPQATAGVRRYSASVADQFVSRGFIGSPAAARATRRAASRRANT